ANSIAKSRYCGAEREWTTAHRKLERRLIPQLRYEPTTRPEQKLKLRRHCGSMEQTFARTAVRDCAASVLLLFKHRVQIPCRARATRQPIAFTLRRQSAAKE